MTLFEGIKAIIFDWGRTIYDKENERLFSETKEVLEHCAKTYPLGIVSLATDDDIEGRFVKLDEHDLRKYFAFALYHVSDKNTLYRNAIGNLGLDPHEILVVDDRMVRLAYPLSLGCKAVWIQKGKFAHETPNAERGTPDAIISNLNELISLLPK